MTVQRHVLVGGGAPHNADGYALPEQWSTTPGGGHAKCSCGDLSPDLRSRNARRAWHQEHRGASTTIRQHTIDQEAR